MFGEWLRGRLWPWFLWLYFSQWWFHIISPVDQVFAYCVYACLRIHSHTVEIWFYLWIGSKPLSFWSVCSYGVVFVISAYKCTGVILSFGHLMLEALLLVIVSVLFSRTLLQKFWGCFWHHSGVLSFSDFLRMLWRMRRMLHRFIFAFEGIRFRCSQHAIQASRKSL